MRVNVGRPMLPIARLLDFGQSAPRGENVGEGLEGKAAGFKRHSGDQFP